MNEDKEMEVFPPRKTTNSPVNDSSLPTYKEVVEADEKARVPVQHEDVVTTQPKVGAGGDADSSCEEIVDCKPAIPEFTKEILDQLDEMINQPRWVIPVLPDGQLEVLLKAAIYLSEQGVDVENELCEQFYRDGLTISFSKVMIDEAVNNWKLNIHQCINANVELLLHLAVLKIKDDCLEVVELLSTVLNPLCRFHVHNSSRSSTTVPDNHSLKDDELYARPIEGRSQKGWLVDQINHFGLHGGFDKLLERFEAHDNDKPLSLQLIVALVRPFGQCSEHLTVHTITKYFLPISKIAIKCLEGLTDDELKKESSKSEQRNDSLTIAVKSLRRVIIRIPSEKVEEEIKILEIFRLKMILRLLQIPSFDGKMNALKEINKVINNVSYYTHGHHSLDDEEWLTSERLVNWLKENKVLLIVLRDCLHQPQYVEKLETIVRFLMKEKALTLQDLDSIWSSQVGKHSTIIQNVHDLLTKLAWDFSPGQLDHLFGLFKSSWEGARKKQRETLLELIRRLAADDKDGVMAHKVLNLLWNLAHSEDATVEIINQALTAHKKILDCSCSQDGDQEKMLWINKFMGELEHDRWVIPALRQIQEICQLFLEAPRNYPNPSRNQTLYRHDVISKLQSGHSIVPVVAKNLCSYMVKADQYRQENPDYDPTEIKPESHYSHVDEVRERLNFLRFLLKDGQLWLCTPQANQIWTCLAENSVYELDRDACFHWFSLLMGEEPDLDPEINKDFFVQNILQLDPGLLTEQGMVCFERFFKAVNHRENKLVQRKQISGNSSPFLMDNLELIGLEYIWRVVMNGTDLIAEKAIDLLQETYTNLGPILRKNQSEIHEDFIQSCVDRLKASKDTITVLLDDKTVSKQDNMLKVDNETRKMIRVLTVMKEYITECDLEYNCERINLPLHRAARGDSVVLTIRIATQSRQTEDFEVWTHTNATLSSVRKTILLHFKSSLLSNAEVEMYLNGELIGCEHNRKLIGSIPLKDRSSINVKLVQGKTSIRGHKEVTSSPDSSSGSSRSSPTFYNSLNEPNADAEALLPGDIMSRTLKYCKFFNEVSDLGCRLNSDTLRDNARKILQLMPPSVDCVKNIRQTLSSNSNSSQDISDLSLEAVMFKSSSSEVLYNLQVLHGLLIPADHHDSEESVTTQQNFMLSGGFQLTMDMLVQDAFLNNADMQTKSEAYRIVLLLAKFALTSVGYACVASVVDTIQRSGNSPNSIPPDVHTRAVTLQNSLIHIPNPNTQSTLRNICAMLGKNFHKQIKDNTPDISVVKSMIKLAWCSAADSLHMLQHSNDDIHKLFRDGSRINDECKIHNVRLCNEALETLTVALCVSPSLLRDLHKDKSWQVFIIDLILRCENRQIRCCSRDQFHLMSTKCTNAHKTLVFFITLLFTVLKSTAKEYGHQSSEFFGLLCRLLNFAYMSNIRLQNADALLNGEIDWLKAVKSSYKSGGEIAASTLLAGHLSICKELLSFQESQKKYHIGCEQAGPCLIMDLIEDFLLTPSRALLKYRQNDDVPVCNEPICKKPLTISAAFDVLVALCNNSIENLNKVAEVLTETFYNPEYEVPLTEWEFLPPVGSCPENGYVGLKNAGATCYMNVIIQQLFMTPTVRDTLLGIEEDGFPHDVNVHAVEDEKEKNADQIIESKADAEKRQRKEYVCKLLYNFQAIFGHLRASKLQYHIPRTFWKHFRLTNLNEHVNLREQQDSMEFYNTLTSDLEEGIKHCNLPPLMTNVFGGKFSDQKICKDCPHRYCRDLDFMSLQLDILLHQNLIDSLENYVKGDLLEGDNAYTCEKCNKKVDTVKRMCFKKLPQILAIHLMRFKYDYDRKCTIKYNDYFEFTREIDMEPYTVQGLSNVEGETIDSDAEDSEYADLPTKYRLVGVVVHSGQASGGHYYAYILQRSKGSSSRNKWYKFDDGDVQECNFDEEELRNQCFGGEYMGEVFDHMMKRMSYRKQKRWWNAYLLFYERVDVSKSYELTKSLHDLSLDSSFTDTKLPAHIHRMVQEQNIHFMHDRMQFSPEYFTFMQRLFRANQSQLMPPSDKQQMPLSEEAEQLAMTTIKLASDFLFTKGFRTKKAVRGTAAEWYDALYVLLIQSKVTRYWFVTNVLLHDQARLTEYLLECVSSEIRMMFAKLIVCLAHFCMGDGTAPPPKSLKHLIPSGEQWSLTEYILFAVLQLLKKDVPEHGRHLAQYFSVFLMYYNLGIKNKQQLLNLDVPVLFMRVALDDGPGTTIKYQYAELNKLFAAVSLLLRHCDVTKYCRSSNKGSKPLDNPFAERHMNQSLMVLRSNAAEMLFDSKKYVKKIIEDNNAADDTVKLLSFLSWENPKLSVFVLSELLWHVAFTYSHELRPFLELLVHILLLEDSWQAQRILHTLQGIPDEREGLLSIIQRSKSQQAKRSYQCIKWLVVLFERCDVAYRLLTENNDIMDKWTWATEWLASELDRRPYGNNIQYTYNNWSPPAQSNETANGYYLERSQSAIMILKQAKQLCAEEEEAVTEDDGHVLSDPTISAVYTSTDIDQTISSANTTTELDETETSTDQSNLQSPASKNDQQVAAENND